MNWWSILGYIFGRIFLLVNCISPSIQKFCLSHSYLKTHLRIVIVTLFILVKKLHQSVYNRKRVSILNNREKVNDSYFVILCSS